MKKFLSEQNIAGVLFVLVMAAFSFAHEDSKKKDPQYSVTANQNSLSNTREITAARQLIKPFLQGTQIPDASVSR